MKYKDYYAALGVASDASAEQIKKAYRKLARQYHPDVSKLPNAEARFKDVAEAYATLKDAEKRAAYDGLGHLKAGDEMAPPHGPHWSQGFEAGGSGAFDAGSFNDIDLADLMAAWGRQGGDSAHAQRPRHGRDYETSARVSLEEAHRGSMISLNFDEPDRAGPQGVRTLQVRIPPGVTDGQKLRLRGKGGKGQNGGADGDIYLHISLVPHGVFRVDQHDLYFDLALSPWEAALGASVQVPTLDAPVMLAVPAGVRADRKLRLRALGLADSRGGRGDLYAIVRIEVPATLSDGERALFQQLADTSSFQPRAVITGESPNATAAH